MFSQPRPKSQQGYGRRKPARNQLIDSCFTFSSPIKQSEVVEICEDKVADLLEALKLDDAENSDVVVCSKDRQSKLSKPTNTPRPESTHKTEKDNALVPRNPNERRAIRLSGGSPAKSKFKKSKNVENTRIVVPETPQPTTTTINVPQLSDRVDQKGTRPNMSSKNVTTTRTSKEPQDALLAQELESLELSPRPRRKRQRPRKADPVPTILHAVSTPDIIAHAQPLLALCHDEHTRSSPLCFQAWADSLSPYFEVEKIAEASYGEVFRLALLPSVQTTFTKANESVLKLIALKAPLPTTPLTQAQKKKQGSMSAVDHVASEVRMLKRMSPVPGFTNFRDIKVVQGRLPKQFCAAWKYYHQNVRASVFPDPSRKAAYDETQLWAVVEMQDAGKDLESSLEREPAEEDENGYQQPQWLGISVWAGWDIFWHVACAVAKGEGWAEFEHRDLHLGNICIRTNNNEGLESQLTSETPTTTTTSQKSRKLGFTALETTIIDYTLSRASMNIDLTTAEDDIAYLNLSADPAVFEGDGDMEYQYDIYRHMRGEVLFNDPTIVTAQKVATKKGRKAKCKVAKQQEREQEQTDPNVTTDNAWRTYKPATNMIWLHFVLYQLMTVIEPPSNLSKDTHLAAKLYARLTLMNETKLTMENLKRKEWTSAGDMVAWAVEEAWLDGEDVIGAGS